MGGLLALAAGCGKTEHAAPPTKEAMDGLFKMVAAEEQQIRQHPAARTTELLQKVFGASKK